jgi:hypothetical protein
MTEGKEPSSFRDPSGFLFFRDGALFRQINRVYKDDYDLLMGSGLYTALVEKGLLVAHDEVGVEPLAPDEAYKVVKPREISFLSYPYEWCFGQLKAAARATIEIQKIAFAHGMCLKDASAYNIQFVRGKPIFIDTLSFRRYRKGEPWVAYRQFCQHFLAPLAVSCYRDIRLHALLKTHMDGIPLDLAGRLLPFRTRFSFSLLTHIHLHARNQSKYGGKPIDVKAYSITPFQLSGIIDDLSRCVEKLEWRTPRTEWGAYYDDTNYSEEAFREKKRLVDAFIDRAHPRAVWDLGANRGDFSRLASARGIDTVSFDIDPAAVESNYGICRDGRDEHLLPLLLDLANPSPGIGWEGRERKSLIERGPVDMALALALVHHLAISHNVPFTLISPFLKRICGHLVIEFVPKEDSQVRRLLASREDVFPWYAEDCFERDFSRDFIIEEKARIAGSDRTLYLMRSK